MATLKQNSANIKFPGGTSQYLRADNTFDKPSATEIDCSANKTLTAAEVRNTTLSNYGQAAGNVCSYLPTAAAGMSFKAIAGTAQPENTWALVADANDKIYLDDVAGNDNAVVAINPAVGDLISFESFRTGESSYDWLATSGKGSWAVKTVFDPDFANVVLLMHMDGSNNGTTFSDVIGHTITRSGAVTKTGTKKFGTASAYFDGSSYLTGSSSDFSLGTGDFTIEFEVNVSGFPGIRSAVAIGDYLTDAGFEIYFPDANSLNVYSNGLVLQTSGVTFSTGTWYSVAVVRHGTNSRIYINGICRATTDTWDHDLAQGSIGLLIGKYIGTPTMYGYIDELRITRGVARHTGDYTPATEQFPDS